MLSHSRRNGVTLIETLIVIGIISLLIGLTLAGIQRVREAAARTRCSNQLHQIGLALHGYHDQNQRFPPGVSYRDGKDPQPFLNWHVRIMPYLERQVVLDEAIVAFRQSQNFLDDPPHVWLTRPMPPFACPSDGRTSQPGRMRSGHLRGLTSYLGVEGKNAEKQDGALFLDSSVRMAEITDGTSNTLLVGERPPSADLVLGWWYGGWGQDRDGEGDSVLGARTKNNGHNGPKCPVGPYNFTAGKFDNQCDAFHFWSPHSGGANFVFADGSVRFLRYEADSVLPALATRAGGEATTIPD